MKKIFATIAFIALGLACNKPHHTESTVIVDLSIIAAQTALSGTPGQDIISIVKCAGTDLCYKFSHFEIHEGPARVFSITARATYPSGGDIACPQAIYYKDTSVIIHPITTGQYILKFYNDDQLFKADTIEIN